VLAAAWFGDVAIGAATTELHTESTVFSRHLTYHLPLTLKLFIAGHTNIHRK